MPEAKFLRTIPSQIMFIAVLLKRVFAAYRFSSASISFLPFYAAIVFQRAHNIHEKQKAMHVRFLLVGTLLESVERITKDCND